MSAFFFLVKVSKNIFDSTPCFFFFLLSIVPVQFFHAWSKKNTFLCFQPLFWKISCFLLCLFLFKKKITSKKLPDSLDFFSLLFLLNLFSFCVSSLFVDSPCLYSSYSLFFSMPPLLLFALFMFIYSLSYVSSVCVYSYFLIFWISVIYFSFFVEKSLIFELVISLCKTFLVLSFFFLFRHLFWLFFRWCSFEQDQVYYLLEARTTCPTNPSKNLFSDFLWSEFFLKKKNYHHIPFQKNLNFLKFLENPFFRFSEKNEETCFTTKVAFATKTFLSRSHFVVISSCSEKYPSLQLFQKSLSLSYLLFSFTFEKSFFLSPLDFLFFLRKSFLFFSCLFNFLFALVCVFLFFFFCSVFLVISLFQFVQHKKSLF